MFYKHLSLCTKVSPVQVATVFTLVDFFWQQCSPWLMIFYACDRMKCVARKITGIGFKDKKRDFRAILLNWTVQWKMGIEIERQWKISHKTSFLSLTASFFRQLWKTGSRICFLFTSITNACQATKGADLNMFFSIQFRFELKNQMLWEFPRISITKM